MGEDKDEVFDKIIKSTGKIVKAHVKNVFICVCVIAIIIIMLCSMVFDLTIEGGTEDRDNPSNVPGQVSVFYDNISLGSNGKINTEWLETSEELWNRLVLANSGIDEYLKNEEQLMKLVNAQIVTQYLDIREDTEEAIDWDEMMDENNGWIEHGIIKLKRGHESGTVSNMKFEEEGIFYKMIDEYNTTGDEDLKNRILNSYTIGGNVVLENYIEDVESEDESGEGEILGR